MKIARYQAYHVTYQLRLSSMTFWREKNIVKTHLVGGEGPLVFTTAHGVTGPVLAASDDDTDNEVLKWCLLPDRTEIIIKVG